VNRRARSRSSFTIRDRDGDGCGASLCAGAKGAEKEREEGQEEFFHRGGSCDYGGRILAARNIGGSHFDRLRTNGKVLKQRGFDDSTTSCYMTIVT
jgi:hypothetical protein